MPRSRSRRGPKARPRFLLQKPTGQISARVQAVGAQHFGIVAIDCAKARSDYLLADFFGNVILEPTTVAHSRGDLAAAIDRIRTACRDHDLRDLVVAIERTGEYHRPVQRAFRAAGCETRLVHPFTTKQYRQPADPDNKTDATDLGAIFRATANGFGLLEPDWPAPYRALQLLRRHRRDLVDKGALLQCQIREALHAAMPGFAECFCHLWDSPAALAIARHFTGAAALRQAGLAGVQQALDAAGIRYQAATLHKALAWADNAAAGLEHADELRRLLVSLDDDRLEKARQIADLGRTLAHHVVTTPYVLLLIIPGLNVVSAADLAGELGPIEHYASASNITGRAGLMPSRYQSADVDHHSGPLRRSGNRRLRGVLLQVADNLIKCNHHFAARADLWSRGGKDARWQRVKVAKVFSRLAFAIVAGRQLFAHPCCQQRHYILDKLLAFHHEHRTPPEALQQDLEAAAAQLPRSAYAAEARPLAEQLDELSRRGRGVQPLSRILPLVLARLGVRVLQSEDVRGPDLG